MAKLPDNVVPAGCRKGEYVLYHGPYCYRVRRSGAGWTNYGMATKGPGFDPPLRTMFLTAPTLLGLARKIEAA